MQPHDPPGISVPAGEQPERRWRQLQLHPGNASHPAGWRVDEQGLINPAVSLLGNWSLAAGKERVFRYGILLYRGPGRAETLDRQFKAFVASRANFRLSPVKSASS